MPEPNESFKTWLPFLLGVAAYVGLFAGMKMRQVETPRHKLDGAAAMPTEPTHKLKDVLSYIHAKYMDSINASKLTDKAIESLLNNLDPYSDYLKPDEVKYYAQRMTGKFIGLGVELIRIGARQYVYDVKSGSSADISGLQIGDEILAVDNISVAHISADSLREIIQNPRDSTLLLRWIPRGQGQWVERVLPIEPFTVPSLEAIHQPAEDVVYIKMAYFGHSTFRECMRVLETFVGQTRSKHLVIDLRDSPGGLVHVAADILNQLVHEKDLLLFKVAGRHSAEMKYLSIGKPFFAIDKIGIIINGKTSSAAEIVAAALQDLDRAIIAGTPSYGKGIITEQYSLGDGSAIRLSTSRVYTYSGRCIQIVDNQFFPTNFIPDSVKTYFSRNRRKLPSHQGVVPDLLVDTLSLPDTGFQRICIDYAKKWIITNIGEILKIGQPTDVSDKLPLPISVLLKKTVLSDTFAFTKRNSFQYLERAVCFEYNRIMSGYDNSWKLFLKDDPSFILVMKHLRQ